MVKTEVLSINPTFSSPYPFMIASVQFEKFFDYKGTKLCNRVNVSVMVEKKNQTIEELRQDAIEAAVKLLDELTKDR